MLIPSYWASLGPQFPLLLKGLIAHWVCSTYPTPGAQHSSPHWQLSTNTSCASTPIWLQGHSRYPLPTNLEDFMDQEVVVGQQISHRDCRGG